MARKHVRDDEVRLSGNVIYHEPLRPAAVLARRARRLRYEADMAEQAGDPRAERLYREAIERFVTHIERWLHNTRQDLYGNGSIPYVSPEGNRVVAASQVDSSLSQGLEPSVEEEDPAPGIDAAPPRSGHSAFG